MLWPFIISLFQLPHFCWNSSCATVNTNVRRHLNSLCRLSILLLLLTRQSGENAFCTSVFPNMRRVYKLGITTQDLTDNFSNQPPISSYETWTTTSHNYNIIHYKSFRVLFSKGHKLLLYHRGCFWDCRQMYLLAGLAVAWTRLMAFITTMLVAGFAMGHD